MPLEPSPFIHDGILYHLDNIQPLRASRGLGFDFAIDPNSGANVNRYWTNWRERMRAETERDDDG